MANIKQNLVEKQFGYLTVIAKAKERGTQGEYKWLCQCDCGRQILVTTGQLNSGQTSSCGHVKLNNLKQSKYRHQKQLNDHLPKNNSTGYKNISMTMRNGRQRYRVSVQYNGKQYSKLTDSLEDALRVREELREKWWSNYNK